LNERADGIEVDFDVSEEARRHGRRDESIYLRKRGEASGTFDEGSDFSKKLGNL
jgi:hypothetical protein